jgi:uncharacterized protein YcbK (DUF882 family)
MEPDLILSLEQARREINMPIIVNSGYRCPAHNKAIGGATRSYHMMGMAADIHCKDMAALYQAILKIPAIKGVGIYHGLTGFIHVDVRATPARWAFDGLNRPMDFDRAVALLSGRGPWKG